LAAALRILMTVKTDSLGFLL